MRDIGEIAANVVTLVGGIKTSWVQRMFEEFDEGKTTILRMRLARDSTFQRSDDPQVLGVDAIVAAFDAANALWRPGTSIRRVKGLSRTAWGIVAVGTFEAEALDGTHHMHHFVADFDTSFDDACDPQLDKAERIDDYHLHLCICPP